MVEKKLRFFAEFKAFFEEVLSKAAFTDELFLGPAELLIEELIGLVY